MAIKQPPLAIRWLECRLICDVCNRPRNRGNHVKCSAARKAKYEN